MDILTHRGLDPSKEKYFPESSREAFADQLARGYGLEFDVRIAKNGRSVISHDKNFNIENVLELTELLDMIDRARLSGPSALHLKGEVQTKENLDIILDELNGRDISRLVIFDIKMDTARYLLERNINLHLAPSVAHEFDMRRYNKFVGQTMISINDVIKNKVLFDWVWLDEWDLRDVSGVKKLYTKDNFDLLRRSGFKIALVTPELHSTSPGLLGGEAHEDARDEESLKRRLIEIISLHPDAICTDYPDIVNHLAINI